MVKKMIQQYELWCNKAVSDRDVFNELREMTGNCTAIEDAFYCDLTFGTGGLRGIIGAGTNRMNVYTVAKASQGLANYIIKNFPVEHRRIAVSYDSRIKSDLFAKVSSGVFAANGIHVFIYPQLMPTPCLSFAVRALQCASGIMITASHNPFRYNGYKVYGPDGCQITTIAAQSIQSEVEKLDIFEDPRQISFEEGISSGKIQYVDEEVYTAFVEATKAQRVWSHHVKQDLSIVYSPLNGTGLKPVMRVLEELGFSNITVVKQQEQPDGRFPTCPYPNPESEESMALGVKCAKERRADLLLATDPDCDRVGVAVRDQGDYHLLSGNEIGILLFDYICKCRISNGTMPDRPVAVTTIVSSDMADIIAAHYGVELRRTLTGFKYIGEQIGQLEKNNEVERYIFGFEESYGYLSGIHVRDKDAVNASMLICEMAAYYKERKQTLKQAMQMLYIQFGFYQNNLLSFSFEGVSGMHAMIEIMKRMRTDSLSHIAEYNVTYVKDYSQGINDLPQADVLEFGLGNSGKVMIRPSGTEPKIKVYLCAYGETAKQASERSDIITQAIKDILK